MIIGITGTLGAGKGTVVEYLKSKGFKHYSSSGILKEILATRDVLPTRANLAALADELLTEREGGILSLSYERAKANGDEDFVLEAIHRPSEAEYVRSIGGIVIGIDADINIRYERVTRRHDGVKDMVTFEQFLDDSKREDEGQNGTGQNIRAVLEDAEMVFKNSNSPEELYSQVDDFLANKGK